MASGNESRTGKCFVAMFDCRTEVTEIAICHHPGRACVCKNETNQELICFFVSLCLYQQTFVVIKKVFENSLSRSISFN